MKNLIFAVFAIVCWLISSNAQSQPCYTPDQKPGSCIDIHQCQSLLNIVKAQPISDANRTYLQRSQCGYFGYVAVCCPNEPNTKTATIGLQISDLPTDVCGLELRDRTFENKVVPITQNPWTALIEYTKSNNEKGFHCGGALINKDYVLTGAHCVNGKELQTMGWTLSGVRLGEWDLNKTWDCDDGYCVDPVLDVPAVERITHENYASDSKVQENDIALLRLGRSIQFTDTVRPICLPVSSNLRNRNYNNVPFSIAGWGKAMNKSNSEVKRIDYAENIPIGQCNEFYRNQNVQLSEKQICAGGSKGEHLCLVDSGGALIALDSSDRRFQKSYLAGVFSFGPSLCGQKNGPGVYTRIDSHIEWILSHMRP